MASGEAEPLQYTTTVLRVSIHCEGCRKKVKKVLHNIEGVYKVTVDAAQHKVTVTGSVGADALIRRLNKAGKQAALWPAPASEAKNRPEDVTAAPPAAGEVCKDVVADKADAKPKEVAKDDEQVESEGSVKKPEKDNKGSEKKPQKDKGSGKKPEVGKRKEDGKKLNREASEAKEKKGSPELAKEAPGPAEETSGEEGSAKKGKKKNKQKDSGAEGEAVAEKPPQPPVAAPAAVAEKPPQPPVAAPAQPPLLGPERPHGGGFPYYAPLPVMSYNVTHPSASVSYYAPTPTMPMQPIPPPQVPYGYPPYPHMMPPEYMYGPPGMRSSPPQESYDDNMFNEENASSCSLM